MKAVQNYSITITVDKSPQEVFAAINKVGEWWHGEPGVIGKTDKLGDVFTYQYGDTHLSTQKVTELVPGKKIVWDIIDATLSFTKDTKEWKGTKVIFEIIKKGDKTAVHFTHVGLVPNFECYKDCSNAWGYFIKSCLKNFITTGKA